MKAFFISWITAIILITLCQKMGWTSYGFYFVGIIHGTLGATIK